MDTSVYMPDYVTGDLVGKFYGRYQANGGYWAWVGPIEITAPALGTVSSLSASNITQSSAALSWGSVTGANTYRYQITTDSSFNLNLDGTTCYNCIPGGNATASGLTASISSLSPNTTYRWHVRAGNTLTGQGSNWSGVQSFTTSHGNLPAPILHSPNANATAVETTNANFDWSNVTGANVYRIVASINAPFSGFNENGANSSCDSNCFTFTSSTSQFSGFSFDPGTIYHWNVRAGNTVTDQSGDWSDSRKFTTTHDSLSAPGLYSPVNGATAVSTSNANFHWSGVSGANIYRIVVSTDSSFSGFIENGANSSCNATCQTYTTSSTQFSGISLNPGTPYHWRVRAGNTTTGQASLWSTIRNFTTETDSQPAPTISNVSASPDSLFNGQTQSVSWTSQYQQYYGLYLYKNGSPFNTSVYITGGDSSGKIKIVNPSTVQSSDWTIPSTLPVGSSYQIKVTLWNSEGSHVSGLSNTFSVAAVTGNNRPTLFNSTPGKSVQVGQSISIGLTGYDQDGDLSSIELDWYGNGNPVVINNAQNGREYILSMAPTSAGNMQWSATAYDSQGNHNLPIGGSITVYAEPSEPETPLSGHPAQEDGNRISEHDRNLGNSEGRIGTCPINTQNIQSNTYINNSTVLVDKPIDLATGAQVETRSLLKVNGLLPIEFSINYNSLTLDVGLVGRGWQLSNGFASKVVEKENEEIIVYWSKNRFNTFSKNGDTYTSTEFGAELDEVIKQADGTFRINRSNRMSYFFDAQNRLSRIENRKGQGLNYLFDDLNRLIRVSEPVSGVYLDYSYNAEDLLSTVTDPLDNQVQLEYLDKNLTKITQADGVVDGYTYNALGQIETRTLDDVLIENNTHDSIGRTTSQDDSNAANQISEFSYRSKENQINSSYKDRTGNTTSYIHSTDYQLLKSTDSLGNTQTYTYDAQGKTKTATDSRGNTTTYTYDANGDLILTEFADSTQKSRTYDPRRNLASLTGQAGNTEFYTYDTNNNLIKFTNKEGNTTTYTYNANGQVLTETSPEGHLTQYGYTSGRLTSLTNPEGDSSLFDYDNVGRLISTTDFAGNRTQYEYDPVGRKVKEIDALNQTQTWTYNAFGQVLIYTDAKQNQTRYEYDGEGNLIKKFLPDNSFWVYTYDGEDRQLSITDPRGNTTTYERDRLGRIVRTIDPLDNSYTTQYDENGNVLVSRSPLGGAIITQYDALNRPTEVQNALGHKSTFVYDARSNITDSTDAENKTTQNEYDKQDQLVKVTDPGDKTANQSFDKDQEITQVVDPNTHARVLTRDKNGQVTAEQTADGITIHYEYDPRGLVTKQTNGRNQTTNYIYDPIGQLKSKTDAIGTTDYSYDENGNLLTVLENGVTATRTYDNRDRVTSYAAESTNATRIEYGYDATSNLITLNYPSTSGSPVTINYTYDEVDRLASATGMGVSVNYELDAKGRVTKTTRGNGTIETKRFDAVDRITQIKDMDASGNVIVQYDFRYDKTGKLVGTAVTPEPVPPPLEQLRDMRMDYGPDNKLDGREYGNDGFSDEEFDSDADGNILDLSGQEFALSTDREKTIYRPDPDPIQPPIVDPSYDDVLAYDVRNQLIEAGDYSFTYHTEGYRIALTHSVGDSSSTTRYLVNPEAGLSQVLRETLPDGSARDYLYGRGLVGQKDSDGSIHYFHYNYRGSVVAVTDNTGTVIARFGYLPYGQHYTTSGSFETPFGYNGRDGVMTDPNGLIYMRARYYSPDQRRFLNKDPLRGEITDLGSLNRYAFVGGDPINAVDPSGATPLALLVPLAGLLFIDQISGVEPVYAPETFVSDEMQSHAERGLVPLQAIGYFGGVTIVGKAVVNRCIKSVTKGAGKAYKHDFKYHTRVRERGIQDPKAHNFPYSFDDVILKTKPIKQSDGSLLYRKQGTLNGKQGSYEIVVNPKNGTIFHRTFIGNK